MGVAVLLISWRFSPWPREAKATMDTMDTMDVVSARVMKLLKWMKYEELQYKQVAVVTATCKY